MTHCIFVQLSTLFFILIVITEDILGERKDELEGDIITEFITGGAKNYGYKTSPRNTMMLVPHFQPLSTGHTTEPY